VAKSVSGSFWVNNDATELIYSKNGNCYFYKNGMEEGAKISSSSSLTLATPVGSADTAYCGDYTTVINCSTFTNSVICSGSNLYWINKKGTDSVKFASDVYDYQIAEDGKSLIYINKKEELYKVTKFGTKMDEGKLLYDDEDVYGIAASADLSKVYLTNDEGELCYLKKQNKVEVLSDDYDGYAYCESSGKLYYIEDEELYSVTTKAKSKKKVADDVSYIYSAGEYALYAVYDGSDASVVLINGSKEYVIYEDD
jgi:hypothetical protein